MKKFFLILIFIFLSFGIFVSFLLPKNPSSKEEKIFVVEKGDGILKIAENLQKENLIKNQFTFLIYALMKGYQKKLKAGTYLLSPSQSTPEILKKIVSGETLKIKITFPEGITQKEIDSILKEKGVTKESILKYKVKDFKLDFDFLGSIPEDFPLEGFLFPDTYFFDYKMEAKEVIKIFLKNFEKKFDKNLRQEIKNQGKDIYQILILASLLEKEVRDFEEKKIVAGILEKRLKNKIPLQVDATITYLTGKKTTKISAFDLEIDSPYNTYKYKGLPPTPICNPGLESIKAAIFPKETPFWYYLTTPEGKAIFSVNYEDHLILKEKYLK